MIVGATVPHYHPTKIYIMSYTQVTIYIPIICIIILTINIFNRIREVGQADNKSISCKLQAATLVCH